MKSNVVCLSSVFVLATGLACGSVQAQIPVLEEGLRYHFGTTEIFKNITVQSKPHYISIDYTRNVSAPAGHVDFCKRYLKACSYKSTQPVKLHDYNIISNILWVVNTHVNDNFIPATDMKTFNTDELWSYGLQLEDEKRQGDCEDYALTKQLILIEEYGFDPANVLMTVVGDEKNEGHAVLAVRTSQGTFILDNKTKEIRTVDQTGYEFIMIQSPRDHEEWHDITDYNNSSYAGTSVTFKINDKVSKVSNEKTADGLTPAVHK